MTGGLTMLRGLVLVGALATAPYQCGRGPGPDAAIDESPGVALYSLAGEFKTKGDDKSWRSTLEFLVKRYPGTREAKMASDDLASAK
jgi:hypothetical protein